LYKLIYTKILTTRVKCMSYSRIAIEKLTLNQVLFKFAFSYTSQNYVKAY